MFLGDTEIGRRIYNLRVEQDVQQVELARAIRMHQSVLNRIEHGTRPARDNEIRDLAKFFAVSADFLLGIELHHSKIEQLNSTDSTSILLSNPAELELIKKYRALDERGKLSVMDTIKREYTFACPSQEKNASPSTG